MRACASYVHVFALESKAQAALKEADKVQGSESSDKDDGGDGGRRDGRRDAPPMRFLCDCDHNNHTHRTHNKHTKIG